MTEQMVSAAAIREWRDKYQGCTANNALEALDALIPAPPRPTLADMTPSKRVACQWMQADVIAGHEPLVITHIDRGDGAALILDRNGRYDRVPADEVTPRPDLPRFVWPGTEKPAPALPKGWRLADHKDDGRVIVTNPVPASDGRVYYVMPNPGGDTGYDWLWCDPDELTYLAQGADQ